jgi:hypothetical protein
MRSLIDSSCRSLRFLCLGIVAWTVMSTLLPPTSSVASGAAGVDATNIQASSCVDGGGTRWSATVVWGAAYTGSDGGQRMPIDHLAWTTGRHDTPTDAVIRSYDGRGGLRQILRWSGSFNYGGGAVTKVRQLNDVRTHGGKPSVRITLGVDGDGAGGCPITFRSADTITGLNLHQIPPSIPADCSVDVTEALTRWIAGVPDHATLSLGQAKCYRVDGTIEVTGRNQLTLMGNGSRLRSVAAMVSGRTADDQRAMFRVVRSQSVSFRDLVITGAYRSGGTLDPSLQHALGIDVRGSSVTVARVTLSRLAGDCIYFGLDGVTKSSGDVDRSVCSSAGRNGVSVTAGHDISVRTTTVDQVGLDAFDVEPNRGPGWGADRIRFESNKVKGYRVQAFSVVSSAPISDITFASNRLIGHGLRAAVGDPFQAGFRPRNITFTGNVSDTRQSGVAFNVDNVDQLAITANVVTLRGNTMASVDRSCRVRVTGNVFNGGSGEVVSVRPLTAC